MMLERNGLLLYGNNILPHRVSDNQLLVLRIGMESTKNGVEVTYCCTLAGNFDVANQYIHIEVNESTAVFANFGIEVYENCL